MKIEEVINLRKEIERAILKSINDFEEKTGLVVEGIDLEQGRKIGEEKPGTRVVSLKVAL